MPEPINTRRGPLYQHSIYVRDVDVAYGALGQLYGEPRIVAPKTGFEWQCDFANLGPIGLSRSTWSAAVTLEATMHTYVVIMTSKGIARASTENGIAEVMPKRNACIYSAGMVSSWCSLEAVTTADVRIDPQFLTAQLEALTGEVMHGPIVFKPQVDTSIGAGARLERLCTMLVDEMAHGTPFDHPIVMMGVYETIARTLLTHQPHNVMHLLEKQAPPSSQTSMRLAEEYLDANANVPIGLTDLTSLTGVSGQSLEAAFYDYRGTTSQQFLCSRRLQRARQRLLREPSVSVTQLAHDAGFLRVEAFESAYVKAFKERCTETLQRGLFAPHASVAPEQAMAVLIASLTPREREVCQHVARGLLHKQIAAELGTSEPTVKKQRYSAMKKLGVSSTAELVRMLVRMGMME